MGVSSQEGIVFQMFASLFHSINCPFFSENLLGCPWKLVTIVSKLGYNLLTGRIQPTFIGVIIHVLSTMDIPVSFRILPMIMGT